MKKTLSWSYLSDLALLDCSKIVRNFLKSVNVLILISEYLATCLVSCLRCY